MLKLLIFQNCNDFLAGDLIRSRTRFAALDETGIIGIACRHEHPFRFYSLRHGERCEYNHYTCVYVCMYIVTRISYIVYALEYIKQHCPEDSKVYLLYDVACALKRHLKVLSNVYIIFKLFLMIMVQNHNKTELLDFFSLAVPVFHAYGHKLNCKVS